MKGSRGLSGIMPLLDVLFILLFSLLALTDVRTSEAEDEEVRVELPAVESGDLALEQPDAPLVLSIDSAGTVRTEAGDEVASPQALEALIRGALDGRLPEELAIELSADRAAPTGVAVELLQALRLRGVSRVQLLAVGDADTSVRFGQSAPAGGDVR